MKDKLKLYGGILLVVLILLIGVMFIIGKKADSSSKEIVYVAKKDSTKEWVYDADYKKEVDAASYVRNGQELRAIDIKAPYININTTSADSTNDNIKFRFNDAIFEYNRGVNGADTYLKRFDYDYYVNGTVLSVVITSLNGINDIVYPHYYTYNYDLEKGSLLTYEEVYTALGYTSDSLEERVSEKISEIINDKMATIQNDSPELRKNNSIVAYKNSIKEHNTKFYLSENGTLNVIVGLDIPIGRGTFENILTIK